MPLSKQIAEKKAQEATVRVNPEIDAKLNRFIQENPDLHGYYNGLSKEQLIRKLVLGKMQKGEYSQRRNQEIAEWVDQNPDIKNRVEERIRNVPAENRQRAFINAAKTEAMNQGIRASTGIRP
ncbi:MAG: hypothetical protein ACREFX_04910 [Opitutaceae bacterium]